MRTYYSGHDAVVTSEVFIWRMTPVKTLAIRDLRDVCITCETGNGQAMLTFAVVGALLGVAAAAAAWTAGTWSLLPVIALATAILVAGLLSWRRPARWLLQARYRGRPVTLYASSDVRVFNQVTRALRRATEAAWTVSRRVEERHAAA